MRVGPTIVVDVRRVDVEGISKSGKYHTFWNIKM
jgi:hypothetical protein